jgi:2-(1,2-epoxy-1,2-dihydrophenyl)acetyl-CoA isomerase
LISQEVGVAEADESTGDLLYTVSDHVATITLNRPTKLNAFSGAMIDALTAALTEAQGDPDVRVVVMTGAGRAFSSGGDLARLSAANRTPLEHKTQLWERFHRIPKILAAIDKPVLAMINGLAVGAGLGMCLMCDIRIAAASARFSTGYIRVGLVPSGGDAYFLTRLLGATKALELLWTGEFIESEEALRLGMVDRIVRDAELADTTYALARRLTAGPQVAIRMIKRLVHQCATGLDLQTHLDLVSSHMVIALRTADHAEGVAAFQERREPRFQGR